MRVLITGANGFIGKNLHLYLAERKDVEVSCFAHSNNLSELSTVLRGVDFVFHLAGINRSQEPAEFISGNVNFTQALCAALVALKTATGKKPSIVYASSIQAAGSSSYGVSKREAERALFELARNYEIPVHVFRLPNVFGKWCKPHYNSVVATFCHNIAHGLPIEVHDPATPLNLVYVDDVIARFLQLMDGADACVGDSGFEVVGSQYSISVGELAAQIKAFQNSRDTLVIERVGAGLVRALYATYVSFLPGKLFTYSVPQYSDPRGVFVEMLKTTDSGQFSFFTAHPGVSRGGHYHHSKTEKFLVIKGRARFRFRHLLTQERHELVTTSDHPEVVETVPGWTHDITNVGTSELIVMLWANEVFDRSRPDTFACPL